LDPETGECHWTDEQLAIPMKKLQDYITAAQEGLFIPDREKDELTEALGNPEHPGQIRGTAGSIPWVVGFAGAGGYRSRERKRKAELSEMQKLNARLVKLEELAASGLPSQRQEATQKLPRHLSGEATWLPRSSFSLISRLLATLLILSQRLNIASL
jgi:hypothetical protein